MKRGKLIAMEGIDGSGKRTQLDLLERALRRSGVRFERISFPQYDSFFGRLVGKFLNGDFGGVGELDAHLSAMLYAGDRYEARVRLVGALATGKVIVADRYVASNLAHQTARVKRARRAEFLRWLAELEYGIFGLPREDRVIYLRVPAREAQRLILKKGARGYTRRKRDILEASRRHLEDAAKIYDVLAKQKNWVKVECYDAKGGRMREPGEIHREILKKVKW